MKQLSEDLALANGLLTLQWVLQHAGPVGAGHAGEPAHSQATSAVDHFHITSTRTACNPRPQVWQHWNITAAYI